MPNRTSVIVDGKLVPYKDSTAVIPRARQNPPELNGELFQTSPTFPKFLIFLTIVS